MDKQLLLAVDGSTCSTQAIEYVASLFAEQPDVGFHVLHCTSSGCSILPEAEDPANSLLPTDHRFDRLQATGIRHLKKAEDRLAAFGVATNRITSSTVPNPTSVATALKGYAEKHLVDSIVVARRGIGVVGEMLLGSVSAELFRKCRNIPLWIIDGEVRNKRFFIAVDGSSHSLMAVDHLAHIFAGRKDVTFLFFHTRSLLSAKVQCVPENFYDRWGKEWCDTHLQGKNCLFTGPIQLLLDAGIDKETIHTLPEPTALEESSSIISNARKHRCGTIVIGRRREGMAKGIFGSISSRTVMQTQNMALWIIG